jgi:hypothetical protein
MRGGDGCIYLLGAWACLQEYITLMSVNWGVAVDYAAFVQLFHRPFSIYLKREALARLDLWGSLLELVA